MFENKLIKTTYGMVHMTRIIASYIKAGGKIEYYPHVQSKWQKYCEQIGVNDDDAYNMYNIAKCGKQELEVTARKFLEN